MAVFFLIEAMAASETLHEFFHEGTHAADHQCVVKAFQSGLVHCGVPTTEFVRPSEVFVLLPAVDLGGRSAPDRLLPPGRAPPVA